MNTDPWTPAEIAAAMELCAAMSEGPWCAEWTYYAVRHIDRNCDLECPVHGYDCLRWGRYDGTAIAAARTLLPRALAMAARVPGLEAELQAAREERHSAFERGAVAALNAAADEFSPEDYIQTGRLPEAILRGFAADPAFLSGLAEADAEREGS